MSTTVVKPPQALRQRREAAHRLGPTKPATRSAPVDGVSRANAKPSEPEPYVRTTSHVLKKYAGRRPSLIVHLHQTHFRLHNQDGSWPYSSPMKALLEHIRDQTIPHDMLEELFTADVPLYEGCMIVEVVDHRTKTENSDRGSSSKGLTNGPAYSIHNYHQYITPSPYVPYPKEQKDGGNRQATESAVEDGNAGTGSDATKTLNGLDKENAQSSAQSAVAKKPQPSGPRSRFTVLFPTPQSLYALMMVMANTPAPEVRNKRQSQIAHGKDSSSTPVPSTPLTASPLAGREPNAKRRKMFVEETNFHDVEARIVNANAPRLYLDPANSFAESQAIVDLLRDPLHEQKPPTQKTRKRTVAEMAADEAQAAEEERFMLIGDERIGPASTAAGNGVGSSTAEGHGAAIGVDFNRFKTLENIRVQHAENEKAKKDEEARLAAARKQQSEVEARKREQERARQEAHAANAAMQRRQQEVAAQQQLQGHPMANSHAHPPAPNMMPNHQHMQFNMSQGQQSSPVPRQQTPLGSSPALNANMMSTHSMGGLPMTATSSNQGAGSPGRPTSAMAHPPGQALVPMNRQISQQHAQQAISRTGTPQMVQRTPNMHQAAPASRPMATPQMQQHGSPANMQNTPVMMPTPHMQAQHPAQSQQMMLRAQQIQQQQAHMQQMQQQRSQHGHAGPTSMHGSPDAQLTPEQMHIRQRQQLATQQAQAQAQQHGQPNHPQAMFNTHGMNRQVSAMQHQQHPNGSPNPPQRPGSQPGANMGRQPQPAPNNAANQGGVPAAQQGQPNGGANGIVSEQQIMTSRASQMQQLNQAQQGMVQATRRRQQMYQQMQAQLGPNGGNPQVVQAHLQQNQAYMQLMQRMKQCNDAMIASKQNIIKLNHMAQTAGFAIPQGPPQPQPQHSQQQQQQLQQQQLLHQQQLQQRRQGGQMVGPQGGGPGMQGMMPSGMQGGLQMPGQTMGLNGLGAGMGMQMGGGGMGGMGHQQGGPGHQQGGPRPGMG